MLNRYFSWTEGSWLRRCCLRQPRSAAGLARGSCYGRQRPAAHSAQEPSQRRKNGASRSAGRMPAIVEAVCAVARRRVCDSDCRRGWREHCSAPCPATNPFKPPHILAEDLAITKQCVLDVATMGCARIRIHRTYLSVNSRSRSPAHCQAHASGLRDKYRGFVCNLRRRRPDSAEDRVRANSSSFPSPCARGARSRKVDRGGRRVPRTRELGRGRRGAQELAQCADAAPSGRCHESVPLRATRRTQCAQRSRLLFN